MTRSTSILGPFLGHHPAPSLASADHRIRQHAIEILRDAARRQTSTVRQSIASAAGAPTIRAIALACTHCAELLQILTVLHRLTADPYWSYLLDLWNRIARYQQTALNHFACHEESLPQYPGLEHKSADPLDTGNAADAAAFIRSAVSQADRHAQTAPLP